MAQTLDSINATTDKGAAASANGDSNSANQWNFTLKDFKAAINTGVSELKTWLPVTGENFVDIPHIFKLSPIEEGPSKGAGSGESKNHYKIDPVEDKASVQKDSAAHSGGSAHDAMPAETQHAEKADSNSNVHAPAGTEKESANLDHPAEKMPPDHEKRDKNWDVPNFTEAYFRNQARLDKMFPNRADDDKMQLAYRYVMSKEGFNIKPLSRDEEKQIAAQMEKLNSYVKDDLLMGLGAKK